MQSSCRNLYTVHLQSRNSARPDTTVNIDIRIEVLQAPWNSIPQLKKHLLSDPTSKSRDKFFSIVESLFNHTAFPRSGSGSDLGDIFKAVIRKVVHGFTTAVARPMSRTSSPSFDAKSELSTDGSAATARNHSAVHRAEEDGASASHNMDVADDVDPASATTHTTQAAPASEMPRANLSNVRYKTRSSTIDGFRTGTTTVNGTTYRCRYMVEQRVTRPVASLPTSTTTTRSQDFEAGPKSTDYMFDPAVFDDQAHEDADLDTQPWEFLDDLTWEQCAESGHPNMAHYSVTALRFPLLARPSHPLPLQGVGYTLLGQPVVHTSQHELSKFRSIAHESTSDSTTLDSAQSANSPKRNNGPFISSDTAYGNWLRSTLVPFPDRTEDTIFSRRSSFAPLIAPPQSQSQPWYSAVGNSKLPTNAAVDIDVHRHPLTPTPATASGAGFLDQPVQACLPVDETDVVRPAEQHHLLAVSTEEASPVQQCGEAAELEALASGRCTGSNKRPRSDSDAGEDMELSSESNKTIRTW